MANYSIGQVIVYGNLGVCRVENVGALSFCGEPAKEYYTLKPFFTQNGDRIYVPTNTTTTIRPVVTPGDAASCLTSMQSMDVEVFCSRNQSLLMDHYQALMQTNSLDAHLKLFKELCRKEKMQKTRGKKMNATDQHFYKLTEQLLSEEFALSLHESPMDVRQKLRAAALS